LATIGTSGDFANLRRARAGLEGIRWSHYGTSELPARPKGMRCLSETPGNLKIVGRVAEAQVIDIGREIHVFMREADKETALKVELGLQRLGMLRRQAHSQPVGWRVGQFRRTVVKTPIATGCVEHIFIRNQQRDTLVTE